MKSICIMGIAMIAASLQACGESRTTSDTAALGDVPVSASAASEADLHVALYPDMVTQGDAQRTPIARRGTLIDATFKSTDRPEGIAEFYRGQLSQKFGDETQFLEEALPEGLIRMQASDGLSQSIEMSIRPEGTGSTVSIQSLVRAK